MAWWDFIVFYFILAISHTTAPIKTDWILAKSNWPTSLDKLDGWELFVLYSNSLSLCITCCIYVMTQNEVIYAFSTRYAIVHVIVLSTCGRTAFMKCTVWSHGKIFFNVNDIITVPLVLIYCMRKIAAGGESYACMEYFMYICIRLLLGIALLSMWHLLACFIQKNLSWQL